MTGDYTSLSAVDIQVIALAYQITKEQLGPEASSLQLKTELDVKRLTVLGQGPAASSENKQEHEIDHNISKLDGESESADGETNSEGESSQDEDEEDDESGWITPSNYKQKIKELQSENGEFQDLDVETKVACLTNDFSMQVSAMMINLLISAIITNNLQCVLV